MKSRRAEGPGRNAWGAGAHTIGGHTHYAEKDARDRDLAIYLERRGFQCEVIAEKWLGKMDLQTHNV